MIQSQTPQRITKGSIQYWPIKVIDAFETINSLDGLDLRFDLYRVVDDDLNEDEEVLTNASASNNGMIALPLVDTTNLEEGLYKLYISFVTSPQTPKLGPFYFKIDD